MMTTCPECGKRTCVTYPEFYAYRIGGMYYCSATCYSVGYYRAWKQIDEAKARRRKERMNDKRDQREKAVEIALSGGDVYAFLESCGSNNPKALWGYYRQQIKKEDPELLERLPRMSSKTVETPEKIFVDDFVSGSYTLNGVEYEKMEAPASVSYADAPIETPETPAKITKPLNYDGFDVLAVKREFGRYSRQDTAHGTYIDYTSHGGDELNMTVEQWREFLVEIKYAAQVLGVKL